MSLWLVRGDRYGKYQDLALEEGFAYHFWDVPNLSKAKSREAIFDALRETFPDAKENKLLHSARQLYTFTHRIEKGDLVAMPLRSKPKIALGKVTGTYHYRTDLGEVKHTLPVDWIRDDVPRTAFGQDLLYSLGAYMTICQIKRNDAEERVREILKGKDDPGLIGKKGKKEPEDSTTTEDEGPTNVEQIAQDQILRHLEMNFKGHELSRLVDAILQAEGYAARLSPPGPDGGVDILAGRGTFGLDGPTLCVQVKSSQSSADVNVFRALQGTMQTFKAEQGLLVSWGGFTKALEIEAKVSFFSVRLWDASNVVEAVLKNYDRLPEELQSELPLKKIWALVIEE